MRNPTAVINRCTAMRGNGSFCDQPSAIDMPFPICGHHAKEVAERYLETQGQAIETHAQMLRAELMRLRVPNEDDQALVERRAQAHAAQSQVYYLRIGDHVKIGVTTNLHVRLSQLRVDAADVLATEPGSYDLENQRHREFAAERVGRRENFNPSPRLLAHIETVRGEHGEPKITNYLRVS